MVTHSSIIAWRIPQTEEPGRLQCIGPQRVRHNWSDLACTHANGKSPLSVSCVPHSPDEEQALRSLNDGYREHWLIEWSEASLYSFNILLVSVLTMKLQSAGMLWMFTKRSAEKQPISVSSRGSSLMSYTPAYTPHQAWSFEPSLTACSTLT